MSDCDQKDCESEERIRAASPPRMEVREEDATDVFDVDQHRSSPDLFGQHEHPLEGRYNPKPLGATGGDSRMDLGNPNSQAVTNNNTASIVHSEMITPVQVVNDNGISKLILGSNCDHANRENCPLSHCREWQQEINKDGVMVFQPTMAPDVIVKYHAAF